MPKVVSLGLASLLLAAGTAGAKSRVVIFNGVATEVGAATDGSADLWLSTADLTRATKFEIKPQGVCTESACYPLPAGRESEFLAKHGDATTFNLSAFARLLQMPAAHDAKNDVWCFGPRPEDRNGYLKSLAAPDFTLADVDGKKHSLSDFRGKKVLLITWASW